MLLDGVLRRGIGERVFPFGYPRKERKLAGVERSDEGDRWVETSLGNSGVWCRQSKFSE